MLIKGLQKLTLLDYPTKTACTIFTGGCNFRCPFCHNASLVIDVNEGEKYETDEVLTFLKKRQGLLDGVCVTGGEPLLQKDIKEFLGNIKSMGYAVKLDTNGYSPDRLIDIVEEKLVDYVAMDIKNAPAHYPETCGLEGMDLAPVYESIDLLRSGTVDYEFRTTVVDELHDENSFRDIAELISGAKRYFLQPFTDRDTVAFAGLHAPSAAQLAQYLDIIRPHVGEVALRG